METIYTLTTIMTGMLVGAAGASLIIKEKAKSISEDASLFSWVGMAMMLVATCIIGAYCQKSTYQNASTNFFTILSLCFVEFYSIISGAILRCLPGVISDLKSGIKTEWTAIIVGIFFILAPLYFWMNGPCLLNRFDGFAFAVFFGGSLSLILYIICSFCFFTARKLT